MNAMGRLNSSTEIIPLQGPSGRNEGRFRQNFRQKQKPYFVDHLIVPRVKQYLEEHKDSVHVDMDAMVDDLQRKYHEYARRKRHAFRQSVDKAFKTVLQQYNLADDIENSESSEEDVYSKDISLDNSSSNQVSGQLMNMYLNRPGLRRGESAEGDKELINISSDEEDAGRGEGSSKIRGANVPSSSGLLPTPTTLSGAPQIPPLLASQAHSGRGGDSTASSVGQSGDVARGKADRGLPGSSSGSGSGSGASGPGPVLVSGPRGGSGAEPSSVRPWPPAVPSTSSSSSSTPQRQSKRPRPNATSSTTNACASSTATHSSALPGPLVASTVVAASSAGHDSPVSKRRRNAVPPTPLVEAQETLVTFADLGGVDDVLEEVSRLLMHLQRPEVFRTLGVPPPRGVLLHGPPGCGKSLLARAVAGELGLPLLRVAGPELVAGVSGASEARVRDLFEQAALCAPCVLFLDEVDALAPPRAGAQREMERRIVAQLLSCLDELGQSGPDARLPVGAGEVLVLGATSRPEALDPALRRAGRFDREIRLGIPDARAREAILRVLCRPMRLSPDMDIHALAKCTPGFVGADLQALTREAALAAVSRVLDEEQQKSAQEVKGNEKTAITEHGNRKPEGKAKDETKSSHDEENKDSKKEVNKDDEGSTGKEVAKKVEKMDPKLETKENMEVIDISDRDTPSSSKTPAPKADSSVTKMEGIEEDEVCIEAEVTSSDTAAKDVIAKPVSSPDDMEVLDGIDDDEEVVPVPAPEPQKSSVKNVFNSQFSSLTDDQLKTIFITQLDFQSALKHVQPSAKREGFATVPDISWDDVGALRDVREELQMAILAPVRHPEAFESLGLTAPAGLLLCGPPGCGKTLIAKAIANEADINFISVKGPELLNMYVGESEKAVRQCFLRARNSAPCVIFFDELDALCPRRTGGPAGDGNSATQRVVNQLLTEMDGVEGRRGVFLLAASNRPDILDPAVLRPGRLDRIVFVGLPDPGARVDILRALTKNGTQPRLASHVNLQVLGESIDLDGCSGADLASLVREAATLALREHLTSVPSEASNKQRPPPTVSQAHLTQAMKRLRPSVSPQERIRYEKLRIQFSIPEEHKEGKKGSSKPSSISSSSQTPIGGIGKSTNETQTENNGSELPVTAPMAAESSDSV